MGLKVPKRSGLRLNDGLCVRRRADHRDHVWSYDFVLDRTHDGRPLRMLMVVDEWTRERLAIHVARGLRSEQVLDRLAAQVLIEAWRGAYNLSRPHSALGYRPPATEAIQVAAGLT